MFNIFKKKSVISQSVSEYKPRAFIFIGRSGCGKGTQADLLNSHLGRPDGQASRTLHVESGALLRKFMKGDSYTQKKISETVRGGVLVPEAVVVSLWTNYLMDNFTGTENIILDGCPRKLHEAQLLDSILRFYAIEHPAVVYINVSRDWSEKRLLGRARGEDDKPESIKRRLDWFETEVSKSLEFFRNDSYYNFIDVNGEQPIEDVHNEILAKLGLNR